MLYLGIDHGPKHVRAVVFSLECNGVVAEAMRPGGAGAGDGIVADPFVWVRALDECVLECLERLGPERSRLAGMAVAGHPQGLTLLTAQSEVVPLPRPPAEGELHAAVRALRRRFGGTPGVVEVLGCPLRSRSAAAQLYWLSQRDPALLDRVALVQQSHDFVTGWLTGTIAAEMSSGSESGLMDVRERTWSATLLDEINPRLAEMLPPIRPTEETPGGLRREIARKWGVPDHLLVAPGGSREALSLFGAGCCNPGEVLVNLAEQGSLQLILEEPRADPTGKLALRCDSCGQWYLSLDGSESARLADEVMEQWGWDRGQFERVAGLVEPGAGGLVFLGGEKGGTLMGIGGGNLTSPNLARAATEAVALELGRSLDHMKDLGGKPVRARLLGMAGVEEGRRRMLADVLGIPVGSAHPVSSPAVGAALQAAVAFYQASGENLSFTEMAAYALPVPDGEWSAPSDRHARFYDSLAERQARLELIMHGGLS